MDLICAELNLNGAGLEWHEVRCCAEDENCVGQNRYEKEASGSDPRREEKAKPDLSYMRGHGRELL